MIAKKYLEGIKDNNYRQLKDVSYFQDQRQSELLEQNILPWLVNETKEQIIDEDQVLNYFDVFLGDFI